ncbi:MAG: SUMF1/EgtB/PvdO family nonheme iron enzyme [Myxococcales bacterium]|nr:SUMF1/EgtB/PvdO family nonheme iron enzyme [Myxococcales bacterium]
MRAVLVVALLAVAGCESFELEKELGGVDDARPVDAAATDTTGGPDTPLTDTAVTPDTAPGSDTGPTSKCPAGMALIPAGAGNPTGFCLDVFEVTESDAGYACGTPPHGPKYPVDCATYDSAKAYCEKLGKFLPSADQWTWAARSANASYNWPWGTDAPTAGDSRYCTGRCEVGTHPPSAQGVYDLMGMPSEWTSNRSGDASTGWRCVIKGNDPIKGASAQYDTFCIATSAGFRCAQYPSG